MAFDAEARSNDSFVIIDMRGEVDGGADETLGSVYASATSTDPKLVLLNFNKVSYINSTGIALIVRLLAEARSADRSILACGLSEHYKEIFEITRLTDFVTIVADEEAALAQGGHQ